MQKNGIKPDTAAVNETAGRLKTGWMAADKRFRETVATDVFCGKFIARHPPGRKPYDTPYFLVLLGKFELISVM